MVPISKISFISLIFVVVSLMSCRDILENEIMQSNSQFDSRIVSKEIMSVETIEGAKVSSTCIVINPYTENDELYLICVPENWNGELIIYAHGYVAASEPDLTFAEAEELAPVATSLGFAWFTHPTGNR